MNRDPSDLPAAPRSVELAELVSETDNIILRDGLAKLGVSSKMIERIKNLDGLATSSGKFLSVSLEKTHRMYFLQLVSLMEMGDELRERLMIPAGQEGYIANDEARAFFNKNYIDMVKEAGNGYKQMLEGAQAMVRMMAAMQPTTPEGRKRKPGFNKMLSVSKDKNAAA